MLGIQKGPSKAELMLALFENHPAKFKFDLKSESQVRIDSIAPERDNQNGEWWNITGLLLDENYPFSGSYATHSKNRYLGHIIVHTH